MKTLTSMIILAVSLTCSDVAHAQIPPGAHASVPPAVDPHHATVDAHAASQSGQPVLPRNAAWAGVMVIVILLGFFLPAAVIGPIARALAPEDEPVTHSHDEPPGASHHHGHHGTAHHH